MQHGACSFDNGKAQILDRLVLGFEHRAIVVKAVEFLANVEQIPRNDRRFEVAARLFDLFREQRQRFDDVALGFGGDGIALTEIARLFENTATTRVGILHIRTGITVEIKHYPIHNQYPKNALSSA